MCGEHRSIVGIGVACQGSSPHVRGAPEDKVIVKTFDGIIPACAGSTSPANPPSSPARDHPRMCGEHEIRQRGFRILKGSSPHVRGAPPERRHDISRARIIPACAGSTSGSLCFPGLMGDHPRMCGEHDKPRNKNVLGQGSSPHVRGARQAYSSLVCS